MNATVDQLLSNINNTPLCAAEANCSTAIKMLIEFPVDHTIIAIITFNFLGSILGIGLNIGAFRNLWRRYQVIKSRTTLLLLHLSISDLTVLCFYCLVEAIWFSTFEWFAGD